VVMELVEDRSLVRVVRKEEENKIMLSVHVCEQDFGKIIGKGGQTIRSIRSLITALNQREGTQVFVDIVK